MERRKFLQLTAASTGGLMMLPNFLTAKNVFLNSNNNHDNILVFIQLNGGNDGLNTFIPFDNPLYYENRPKINISKNEVINAINGLGFHPALKDLATISQEGQLTIIQNVGYPNPNRSHFRSQEIWQTSSGSDEILNNGWLGRFLEIQCKDEDIASVNIDGYENLALKAKVSKNITIKDFNKIKELKATDTKAKLSDNPQLDFVKKLQYVSLDGIEQINQALKNAKNFNESYPNNKLSKNLEWISKLIKGGMKSKIYYTSSNGFDTHSNQLFIHQRQLVELNDAVFSFYKDLKNNNLLNRVTIVVFSEFGRRVKENGSGTDHGTAGPMIIIGGNNKGRIIGKNPDLNNLNKGDLIYENDFRSVYATLLKDKFNFDPKLINIKNEVIRNIF